MADEFRVLLVEDEEAHAELIAMAFSRSGVSNTLVHASSIAAALENLETTQPDIIIADWMLPDGKGLDLLDRAAARECPFIIMTSHGSEQVAVDALKAGALDYIVKSPMAFEQMPRAAQRAIREWRHIEEHKLAEEKYRSIVEGAPVGIVSVTPDGTVTAANPALAKIYGYESVEQGYDEISHIIDHYKDPKDRERLLREIAKHGAVKDFEMEHLRRDGSVIWVSFTANAAYDDAGNIVSLEGFLTDITERKLSESRLKDYKDHLEQEVQARTQELEESRQRLLDIIEFLPDATFVVDREGTVVAWNHAMAELTGVSKDRVIGRGDHEYAIHLYGVRKPVLIDLILAGKAQHVIGPMKGGDKTFRVETSLDRLRGGKGAYVAIKASPLIDNRGEIVGAIESVRDITQRKKAELALKEQLSFIQALIDIIPSAIFYCDSEGAIMLCNKAFEHFMGLERQQIVGTTLENVFSAEFLRRQNTYEHKLESGTASVVFEDQIRRGKGPNRDVMVHKAAHHDSDGHVLGVVTVMTDIAERKQMEDELIRAKEIAEAANSAKSRFLATMSHEIRTPMNAIMGLTDLTLQQPLTGEQKDNLTAVMDSAHHLLVVINDILDYSKIEADKLELEKTPFAMSEVVDPLRHTFASQADLKNVVLSFDVDPDMPEALEGDPFRLRQVLINLLGNALKFTHEGDIRLGVRIAERAEDRVQVEFRVADSGIGIAQEKLSLIFESFSQAEGDTTRRYGGTGLGLTISARLVEMMGGQLEVDSEQGRGSVFRFTVDFGICDMLPEASDFEELDVGSGLSILVAEDNALNAKVAVQFFARMGHSAVAAGDGSEVLTAMKAEQYDMVFMDLEMPTMDGLETTRRIRAGESGTNNCDIPIVTMTAHALAEVQEKCMDVGMNHFVTKPIEYGKLRAAVAAVLGNVEKAQALARAGEAPAPPDPEEDLLETLPVLDWQDFLADLGDQLELMSGFYDDFMASLPVSRERLETALRHGDLDQAVRVAHALKGSAGTARAGRVSELARRLERDGKETGLEAMLPLMERFGQEADACMAAMQERPWSAS